MATKVILLLSIALGSTMAGLYDGVGYDAGHGGLAYGLAGGLGGHGYGLAGDLGGHGGLAYGGYSAAPLAVAHAAPAVAAAPVTLAHAAPAVAVAGHAKQVLDYVDPHPSYKFEYAVHDAHTGDVKSQSEAREGDVVHGSYSLVEPDGSKRVVEYTADPHRGFNAVVHRTPNSHPAVVQKVAVAAAPVAVKAPFLPHY